jgi:catechol 2,3-dioxygenase-like lactoylglutathione lyase family enzyme
MDNVGIVVDDLGATIDFFRELGLEFEGQAMIEGEWAGRVTGLADQRVEIAMMRTPDGHGRLGLSRFLTPPVVADHRKAPVNALVLPPRDVRRGRYRRDAWQASQARRTARGRRSPVSGLISALLHPRS